VPLNLLENANRSKSLTFSEFESILNAKLALGLKRNHHLVIDLFPVLSFLQKVKMFWVFLSFSYVLELLFKVLFSSISV